MARPTKQGIEYFPEWNITRQLKKRIERQNKKERYKAIRNSSSGFIKKKEVQKAILEKCNYRCAQCGNFSDLQIDHIKSVHLFSQSLPTVVTSKDFELLKELNSYDNLQILCSSCNSGKLP